MADKHIVLKESEAVTLLHEARLKFMRSNIGVRATDETVVLAAFKNYLKGDDSE